MTLDTDFADIRVYPPEDYFGLIVLRLKYHDKGHVIDILARLVNILSKQPIEHHLWIVEENRIRISGEDPP